MAYDENLAERIRAVMGAEFNVNEKKMFGGVAFMIGGNMACGPVGDELMVRVGPEAYDDALARPHARPCDFTGRPMRGMVLVGRQGIASDDDLAAWVESGAAYARSLPAK
ncbi:MAG TPA: TfoX/Sxy family protein [Dehalococcoidia bacterium]|nr:TfoX/Sxy family protein [Dehalococcoidia bacterium]